MLLSSAAIILSVEPALAAIAFINYTDGGLVSATNSQSADAANHTTGNFLVVMVSRDIVNAITVTDTAGNIYTQIGTDLNRGGHYLGLFYCYNIIGNAANVVTATFSGTTTNYFTVAVYQFSGMGTVDNHGLTQQATGSSTAPQTAALTPPNPGIVVAIVEADGAGQSAGAGFSGNVNSKSGLPYFFTEYQITSVSVTPISNCISGAWGMNAAAFGGSPAGGSSSFGGMTMGLGAGH